MYYSSASEYLKQKIIDWSEILKIVMLLYVYVISTETIK